MIQWQKPPAGQITPHFCFIEAACRCCGRIVELETIEKTAQMMEAIRTKLGGQPLKVLSWCRCPQHNKAVGGATGSLHMQGLAVDFVVKGLTPGEVQVKLRDHDGGMGKYLGFTHADRGPRRRWTG